MSERKGADAVDPGCNMHARSDHVHMITLFPALARPLVELCEVDTLLHPITKCLHPADHLVDSHCISGLKRLAYRTAVVSPIVATRALRALNVER
jgi:hypothetical protein